jgi:hypothetical protein
MRTDVHVSEEKEYERDSVEYGEIPLVLDRWGNALLQVKDQKSGNIRTARKRKTGKPSTTAVPSASLGDQQPKDCNYGGGTNAASAFDGDEPVPTTPVQKAHVNVVHSPPVFAQTPLPAPRHFVQYATTGLVPVPNDIPLAQKQVRFQLLPPAEIKSIAKPPNMSESTRAAKIVGLKAQLAALEAQRVSEREDDTFKGYECLDVSMDGGNVTGNATTPEIYLRRAKDTRLFEFEKQPVPLPRGDVRHSKGFLGHQGLIRRPKGGVPRVSPLSFYQGIAVPPSARVDKGKQRELVAVPSSPLQEQFGPYTQQRYLTSGSAGPSRETFM